MNDSDVRIAVREHLTTTYREDSNTRIVEEMGIWSGSVRIDIAVINGSLCGYELKSDRDTLERLPLQSKIYSRVFDYIILVASERHIDKAVKIIPSWWGLTTAAINVFGFNLSVCRASKRNPSPDPYLIAQLLWKEEVIKTLESFGLAKGCRSKPVTALHKRLAEEVPFGDLTAAVRNALKERVNWLGQPIRNKR